ncbi:hypothetical protein F5Y16DRAFT_127487 [Xylariaceae sp. FL0255]|nr:hypothetical protein F5Y16DRAFT_127487 [Xylariaceae sp. FL0255]
MDVHTCQTSTHKPFPTPTIDRRAVSGRRSVYHPITIYLPRLHADECGFLAVPPLPRGRLKLHEIPHLPGNPPREFSQQRAGPWKVKRRGGCLAYELDLPETFDIHPVISAARLSHKITGKDPFHRQVLAPGLYRR